MENRVKGAWLVHNAAKLAKFATQDDFEATYESGRAGVLLSALSQDTDVSLDSKKVSSLASANNIGHLETRALLLKLQEKELIKIGNSGITVLGVASSSALEHTADIFTGSSPKSIEMAAIDISESLIESPAKLEDFREEVADTYLLSDKQFGTLIERIESFGIVDYESVSGEKIYFNGNLFKMGEVEKSYKVLQSLNQEQRNLVSEVDEKLRISGCIDEKEVRIILGHELMDKLNAISYYDINIVRNTDGEFGYVTLPSAFKKFGSNPIIDDAFDNAKALISSLTYGMTRSPFSRGNIRMLTALLNRLIAGNWVGPVKAIGYDYRALEMRGVVEVSRNDNKYGEAYSMRLLKKEVGEIALRILGGSDVTEMSLEKFPGTTIRDYTAPEEHRYTTRKTRSRNTSEILDMLGVLRGR